MLPNVAKFSVLEQVQSGFERYNDNADQFVRDYGEFVFTNWKELETPIRNYMASTLFANVYGYTGAGLRSGLFAVASTLLALRVHATILCTDAGEALDRDKLKEAIRLTDFFFYHAGPRDKFFTFFGQIEKLSLESLLFTIPD